MSNDDTSVLGKGQRKMRERFGIDGSEGCCDVEIEQQPPESDGKRAQEDENAATTD